MRKDRIMAWLFGKKKQEIAQPAQAPQTHSDKLKNDKTKTEQKPYFLERDKKTLKSMLDDAQMISIRLNQARPPRLNNEELLTAALGFYLNEKASSSYRFMKDLTHRREKVGEWTYYAVNLFAFGEDMTQKEPKMAADLRMRQIAEDSNYKVQPGDVLGVVQDIGTNQKKIANVIIDKENLLKALSVRLLAAKSAVVNSRETSKEGFSYNVSLSDTYLYQAASDLAESDLWVRNPSPNTNYYPERLKKKDNDPLALYWLYQCGVFGIIEESQDTLTGLKKAAESDYPPAVHQLYVDYKDQLSVEERAELESKMGKLQSSYTEYLLQLDENNIESFKLYVARIDAVTSAKANADKAAQLYEKNINNEDQDTAALDMFRAATLGNTDAYNWIETYAYENKVPKAMVSVAGRLLETYKATGDAEALNKSKQLYEEARAGGSGEASYQLWLNFKDFYNDDDADTPAFRIAFLEEAVRRRYLPAFASYVKTFNPDYRLIKVMSDAMEKILITCPSFINKWHAMNAWKNIALSPNADLPLAAFALAGFCKLYIGRQVIGTTDYHPKNYNPSNKYIKFTEVKPTEIKGFVAANLALIGDADDRAAIGEMFRDDPKGILGDIKEREELAQLWFRMAEEYYLLMANSGSSYDAARLCRLYAKDIMDFEKAEEWRDKAINLRSIYVELMLWDCRKFFGYKDDFLNNRIYDLKHKKADPGYLVGSSLENYIRCDVNNKEDRWLYTKRILEGEKEFVAQLIERGEYNVERTPIDPEGEAMTKKISEGFLRTPELFTEYEQLRIHDKEFIHEKYLEQQRLEVLEAVKEHFGFEQA